MQQRPQCLTDGKFLVKFYILHPADKLSALTDQRYWLQYHELISTDSLAPDFHLVQPSEFSHQLASKRNLVAYTEWINLLDPSNILHGPFDFAITNGRQTRDRISLIDWQLLISCSSKYDNDPPTISRQKSYFSSLSWNQPIITLFSNTTNSTTAILTSGISPHYTAIGFHSSTEEISMWTRFDTNVTNFQSPSPTGPKWNHITRRTTVNLNSNSIIEDIHLTPVLSASFLQRHLPSGVSAIKTTFYYIKD